MGHGSGWSGKRSGVVDGSAGDREQGTNSQTLDIRAVIYTDDYDCKCTKLQVFGCEIMLLNR